MKFIVIRKKRNDGTVFDAVAWLTTNRFTEGLVVEYSDVGNKNNDSTRALGRDEEVAMLQEADAGMMESIRKIGYRF